MNKAPANPVRFWEYVYLAALAGAILVSAWLASGKHYLGHDELFTSILCQNPNPGQMVDTIARGGETNPPLFFLLEWAVTRAIGTSDFAWRLVSALSIGLAGWVFYFCARPAIGPRLSALAVAMIVGLSRDVFVYASTARYYGLFLLLVALSAQYFLKFTSQTTLKRRDYVAVFLVHTAMVYLHLFGGLYSFMLLLAQLAMDRLHRQWQWRLYACVLGAWASLAFWLPHLAQQRWATKDGTWTPRTPFGLFIEDFSMQTPMAMVLLLVAMLALLAWLSRKPPGACRDAEAGASHRLPAMVLLALAWMVIPVAIWAQSQISQPLYLRRYVFGSIASLVFLLAVLLGALYRISFLRSPRNTPLPSWLHDAAFYGVLVFCLGFQALRAQKEPPKPPTPYVDKDYGYAHLPIAFESTFDYLPRAFYPNGRPYWYLLDKGAENASTGYYTKLHQRLLEQWVPHYPNLGILQYTNITATQFLVVHFPPCQVFEYLTNRHPELKVELLGDWHDQESKVYLVTRPASDNRTQ